MKLYLIRHAPAEERHLHALTKKPDSERPLSSRGREKMKKIASRLKKIEPSIDIFFESPLERASQTTDILHPFYPDAKRKVTKNLAPGHLDQALFSEIEPLMQLDSMALIGHEPDLGQFLSWMLHRRATNRYRFKKGGIAKLDIYSDGQRYLKWFVGPKFLLEL